MRVKEILKSSAIYGFLNFLPLASRLFLFPIFVNFLTPFDYGVLGLHASVASLMTIIISSGLDSSFSRYFFDYEGNPVELKKYLSTILFTVVAIGILLGAIILPLGGYIFEFVFVDDNYTFFPYGIYAYLFAFGTAINGIILIYFRNKEQPVKYLIFTLSTFLLMIAFEAYSIFFIKASAETVLVARILGLYIPSIILWITVASRGVYFKYEFLIPAFKYGWPILIYLLLGFAYLQYDRILVGNLLSIEQLGVYNVAITIASVLELAIQAMDMALLPTIFKAYKQDQIGSINWIFKLMGYTSLVIVSIVLALSPYFITSFTPDFYHGALILIPIFLIGYLFRFYVNTMNKPLYYYKKLKGIPFVNLSAGVVIIVSNLLLIPALGLLGAAVSMVLSRLVMIPIVMLLSKKDVGFVHKLGEVNTYFIISILILTVCASGYGFLNLSHTPMYLASAIIGSFPAYLIVKNWNKLLTLLKQ